MSSATAQSATRGRTRRGTVLIMVVGVLAMLFIIGSTLLIVARFERKTAEKTANGRNLDAILEALEQPVLSQLRAQVVGDNNVAYDRPWNTSETSQVESYENFSGLASGLTDAQNQRRGGNLLLASPTPYSSGSDWKYWATSWLVDTQPLNGAMPPVMNVNAAMAGWPPTRDADGDGLCDSPPTTTSTNSSSMQDLSRMFGGGTYQAEIRVVPNGGMVLIDPFTHPRLLAQVIHPLDTTYYTDPTLLWPDPFNANATNNLITSSADEGRLRRRSMLPADLGKKDDGSAMKVADLQSSSPNDLRARLPVTLGYTAPSGAPDTLKNTTPHWWPLNDKDDVTTGTTPENDAVWRDQRLSPPAKALTESGYSPSTDTYDRRQMITTASSDDLLRRLRDERRFYDGLGVTPTPANIYGVYAQLYRVLNADAAGGSDAYGIAKLPAFAYGLDPFSGKLAFNVDGLRTAFSLRDVLGVAWNPTTKLYEYDAGSSGIPVVTTQTRALQLTAYFLAMMQHSSVPGSDRPTPPEAELVEQLKTAAQLAVNAIDYADADNVPTRLAFNWTDSNGTPTTPRLQVFGYEKQPFITEAYAKVVQSSAGTTWTETPLNARSIFAIELYNPYPDDMLLTGYKIKTKLMSVDLTGIVIKGYSYIVLANRYDDDLLSSGTPFWGGSTTGLANDTNTNQNFFYPGNLHGGIDLTITGQFQFQPMVGTGDPIESIRLIRTVSWDLATNALTTPAVEFEVDRLETTDTRWAEQDVTSERTPNGAGDLLVRDRSLLRHKEDTQYPAMSGQYPPRYWHFTLSQQVVMPPVEYEQTKVTPASETALTTDSERPAQHSLMLSDRMFVTPRVNRPYPSSSYMPNYKVAETYFQGIPLAGWTPFVAPPITTPPPSNFGQVAVINGIPLRAPLAPLQLVTADRGVNPNTGGTLAFPTTGSLLLVPRYTHGIVTTWNGTDWVETATPMSVAATRAVWIDGATVPAATASLPQMQVVDNGHLPVFDSQVVALQQCSRDLLNPNNVAPGGPQGRLSGPWGQLIYDYFTALPLDELVRRLPVAVVSGFGITAETLVAPFNSYCGYALSDMTNVSAASYAKAYYGLFPWYPRIDRVAGASSAIGARVLGRIDLNYAPWWVLDGLPVLPNGLVGTADAIPPSIAYPLFGAPMREILSGKQGTLPAIVRTLDPQEYFNTGSKHDPAACVFLGPSSDLSTTTTGQNPLFDPGKPTGASSTTDWLPSVSPTFAKYMVSYREQGRMVDGVQVAHDLPGFVSVGDLASLLTGIKIAVNTLDASGNALTPAAPMTMDTLRCYTCAESGGGVSIKPFAYLGYLQMVTPMVRLEDWVTVKSHVFTIYSTVGDTSDPQMPLFMRSQMTVDRTNCLYKADELPQKITEQPAISYQNAVDDK